MSFKILVLLALAVVSVYNQTCQQPQKSFYLSYNSISNRDYLTSMFELVDTKLSKYNMTYQDNNGSVYDIINMSPQLYYSEHYQEETFVDQYQVNVTLGQLYLAYRFNFTMKHQQGNFSGWARGRVLLDDNYFTKKIIMTLGILEWDTAVVPDLTISRLLSIQYSNPALTVQQSSIFTQLLNDHLGSIKLKTQIINSINTNYKQNLKTHLNHQDLISTGNFTFTSSGVSINFSNTVRDFKMDNTATKGLEAFFLFGIQNQPQQCKSLPQQFDQKSYGGVQQIYSMNVIKATVRSAVRKGLFDFSLNSDWETPFFQFYMGDLGNFVDYANTLTSSNKFNVSCKFSTDRQSQFKVTRYDDHDIYLQIPQECLINYNNQNVLKITMDCNIVVRITAENDNITATVTSTGIFGQKYESLNPKFIVTDKYIAKYSITSVLNSMVRKNVFGTGWKTIERKYPVIRILDDYVVLFDASQK